MKEVVHIGADHAGFELKEYLKQHLIKKGYQVYDAGAHAIDKHDDYPDYALKVAREVSENQDSKGILCCGSAQGMCIVANKLAGVRAVAVRDVKEARVTRTHNNANVLCLAGWRISQPNAAKIVDAWLTTLFSNEPRHVRRLQKITDSENRAREG